LTDIVTYGSYLIIVTYLLTVIAAAAWVWRHGRPVVPLIVLSVGVVVLGGILYYTFDPFPPYPFDWDVWAAVGSAVLGVALAFVPVLHRRFARSELLRATRLHPDPAEAAG
ncbi:MAG: hypothetical protein ACRDL8_16975, partial [Solirubrobacteraceae bacterium]